MIVCTADGPPVPATPASRSAVEHGRRRWRPRTPWCPGHPRARHDLRGRGSPSRCPGRARARQPRDPPGLHLHRRYVLAAAGLLDGRPRPPTGAAPRLPARFPAVKVDDDVLFVDDGDVLTSAGVAAGVDLCLHLIRRDHGTAVANRVARRCVVPPWRDGGQAQFIERPVPERPLPPPPRPAPGRWGGCNGRSHSPNWPPTPG